MSMVYTEDGDIVCLDNDEELEKYQINVFRKMKPSNKEIQIAKIIQQQQKDNQMENVVKILKIENDYIDMELLDTISEYVDEENMENINKKNDIYKALKQLNKHGIAYIDLREDNIGFSHNDNKWKLFDFDSSGIADIHTGKWKVQPDTSYYLRKIIKENKNYTWEDFDKIRFNQMFNQSLGETPTAPLSK